MHLQVERLILWPRRGNHPPRELRFKLGAVNVISGASKTGKSAIIPIIDYCLGSERCAIPVSTIRDATSWFGVVVQSSQGQHLFARREPEGQRSTGDMFVVEGPTVDTPQSEPTRNTSVEAVKTQLDVLAGLTNLDFDVDDTGRGFTGRPSFRDMVSFVFQPQNVVANPNVLFYKADSYQHREKLRTIFPYVLGAIPPRALALQHQLRQLRQELGRKEREFKALAQLSLEWMGDLRSRAAVALELGLTVQRVTDETQIADVVGVLRGVLESVVPEPTTQSGLESAVRELLDLEREESRVSRELASMRRRYSDMERLREGASEYTAAIGVRRDRLAISQWFQTQFTETHQCPVCGSEDSNAEEEVTRLVEALGRAESEAESLNDLPLAFEREFVRVQEEMREVAEKLAAVRLRRRALADTSAEMKEREYTTERRHRFLGELQEALARHDRMSADGDLAEALDDLRAHVAEIEGQLRPLNERASLQRTLERFSLHAGRITPKMDVERPDDPLRLSIDDLTLQVVSSEREDYLWEIGSGANWVSYHVATFLSLHRLFREIEHSPVPGFAVLDQPSQVYFPRPPAARTEDDTTERPEIALRDEDVIAVRRIFETLCGEAVESQGAWQAIVLDHAGRDVWEEVPGVHLVEEWRGGTKLVPEAWLAG